MKQLSDIISEIIIKAHPDWNKLQISVFKSLQDEGYRMSDIEQNMLSIGRALRNHMDEYPKLYNSWSVESIDGIEDLKPELIDVAKNVMNNSEQTNQLKVTQ